MSGPLISVIMAAYNCDQFVGEAVRSIQEQSYGNWEMICVDDCSTDGTYDVLQGLARSDGRIKVLRNEENLGCSATRNAALEHAQGELIALQDADDLSLPDRFERSLPLVQDADLVGSDAFVVDEAGRQVGSYRAGWDPRQMSAWDCLMWGRALFVIASFTARREALPIPMYNALFRVQADYDMLLRMAALGCRFRKLDSPVYVGRLRKAQVTNRLAYEAYFVKLVAQQGALALREGQPFDYAQALAVAQEDPGHVARAHLRAGWIALMRSDLGLAKSHLGQAARMSPTRAQALPLSVLSYLPRVLRSPIVSALITVAEIKPAVVRLARRITQPSGPGRDEQ